MQRVNHRISPPSKEYGAFHQLWCHWCVRSDLVAMWINWCFLLQCCVSRGWRKGSSVRHHICGSLCPSRCLNYSCSKAPAHICRDRSFPALWACSNVPLWGPKLPFPSHPVAHSTLSWPQTPSSSSSTLALCSIFQSLPPYPIAFSLHLPCHSFTLWLYKDGHFIPFACRFSFLSLSKSTSHFPLPLPCTFETISPFQSSHHPACSFPASAHRSSIRAELHL